MLHFLTYFVLFAAVVAALAYGSIYLFTSKGSKVRSWVFATPDRVGFVGVGTLLLLWIGVVIFNRVTGS